MLGSFINLVNIKELRNRLLFTIAMIAIFRVGVHITIPGIDSVALTKLVGQGNLLEFFDLFTGGALIKFSIFALGIVPYINSSIIMQLLTAVVPQLEELNKEGESGRKQISTYVRYLAVALAIFQSFGVSLWLRSIMVSSLSFPVFMIMNVVTLTAGSIFVMWLGEIITERGIGNGASLIIFIGIISRIPTYFERTALLVKGGASIINVIILLSVFVLIIISIIAVQEAQRRIQIQYAKRVVGRKVYGGQATYLPIKLNQGGVLPIIFASSVVFFPVTIAQFIQTDFAQKVARLLQAGSIIQILLYFVLVFFFTYFYTAVVFNPKDIAENIKKYGGFIIGIRPGEATAKYLDYVVSRLTLFGALFLSILAILPSIAENITKINTFSGLGSTALLIMVGVALDLIRQIQTFLISGKYERLVI